MTPPLAHLGHYLWILYILPVVIVVGGIVRSTLLEKRRDPGSLSEDLRSSEPGEGASPAGGTGREAENEHLARSPPSP
jgi:cytochrome c-type biogenesis protein CcmH/NrfF